MRAIYRITGTDADSFLQGLITTDIKGLNNGLIYTALLTPQGKYLADFFLLRDDQGILLDVAASHAAGLIQRLNMYRLRADVVISETGVTLARGTGPAPAGALLDPRHPDMGWRVYSDGSDRAAQDDDGTDWDAIRVAHCIPETGIELTPDSYILEAGFERLNGVDFRKGCYVGQEVTARMKHKTELRKGLATVRVNGAAEPGTNITAEGKPVGVLYTQSGGQGIAYLRFDRAQGVMQAGGATVTYDAA
ncbi:folate-binding protein [Roseovarius aestuarii]|nr:folate-binding protein [Roseovarius aestuarii]